VATSNNAAALGDAIAIVGIGGRFPGVESLDGLWQALCEGRECFDKVGAAELETACVDESLAADPSYVPVAAKLSGIDLFDADFFSYTAQQAVDLDPQQRLFLETAWHALEDAACNPDSFRGSIGVFGGAGFSRYRYMAGSDRHESHDYLDVYGHALSVEKDFLATRVSYKLDLTGPSVTVQTACSTSLAAIHIACQSLRTYECDLALAGGVSLQIPHGVGYVWHEGGIASKDGHCRAFDAAATGTVPSSGVAMVVLRRLADALHDGNHIYALIRGSAINNDGADKVGYTAPSVSGQAAVIAAAHAELDPATIGLLEAHGTGTVLGDAVELIALNRVFPSYGRVPYCALGSVKTNVGHLDVASGAAGVIKAALCLKHRKLVPTLHFRTPNKELLPGGAFYVNTELREWDASASPRRAAVSSFGIGGTNAHVLMEEAPPLAPCATTDTSFVFPLSARNPLALRRAAVDLAAHLLKHADVPLGGVARTLQQGRKAFAVRRAVVAGSRASLLQSLESLNEHVAAGTSPRFTFLFPELDHGAIKAVAALVNLVDSVRTEFECCVAYVSATYGERVRAVFTHSGRSAGDACDVLVTRCATFIAQHCLAGFLRRCGIEPSEVAGVGFGNVAALEAAGLLEIAEGLRFLCGEPLPRPTGLRAARDDGPSVLSPTSCGIVESHELGQSWLAKAVPIPEAEHVGLDEIVRSGRVLLRLGALGNRNGVARVEQTGLASPPTGPYDSVLRMLAQVWELGGDIDWSALDGMRQHSLLPLPGYPFERQRYWTPAATRAPNIAEGREDGRLPVGSRYFVPSWRPLPDHVAPFRSHDDAPWLIIGNGRDVGEGLADRLRSEGVRVILLSPSAMFRERGGDRYDARLASVDDFRSVLTSLAADGVRPFQVVHCGACGPFVTPSDAESYRRAQCEGSLSLLAFVQSFSALYPDAPMRIVALTRSAAGVPTDARVNSDGAALHSLVTVLAQEFPSYGFHAVDLPDIGSDEVGDDGAMYLDWLLADAARPVPELLVAYRNGRRLKRALAPVSLNGTSESRVIRKNGVYLITGGLGRLGLTLAEHLNDVHAAKLLLVSRSAETLSPDRAARVENLRARSAGLMVAAADVCDEAEMSRLVAAAEERFGPLNGVFHLAGDLSDPSCQRAAAAVTQTDWETQSRPKVQGFLVLDSVLGSRSLDLAVAFSSNASVFGGVGFAAYAASNAYLNAAATDARRRLPWIAVGWDGWDVIPGAKTQPSTLQTAEGFQALTDVIEKLDERFVIVSAVDPGSRLLRNREAAAIELPVAPSSTPTKPRSCSATYVAPGTELERRIARMWEEELGVAGIGVQDDLFDLNGDSLTAMAILARVRESLHVDVPLREFIGSTATVHQLSAMVAEQLAAKLAARTN
jgi:acyl transferase domain-containing protein